MSSNTSSTPNTMSTSAKTAPKAAKVAAPKTAATPAPVPASVPVVAAAPAPVPAVAPVAKAPRAKKVVAAAATETTDVAEPVAAAVGEEDELNNALQKSIADLHEHLKNQREAVSATVATLKTLEAQAKRVMRKNQRRGKRSNKTPAEGAKPCHFNVPGQVVPELLAFLGLPKDSLISRTDVTKSVLTYCKDHGLMDGKSINPDAALSKLLKLKEGDSLNILNLQTYLKSVHVKKTKPVATA